MAISKVILNGNTLMDATTATASASDIALSKTAMLADGVMTTGTGSGGETTYVTLFDEDLQMVAGTPGWAVYEYYLVPFIANQTYRITWNGVPYICETQVAPTSDAYDGYMVGNASIIGEEPNTGEPFIIYRQDFDDPDPNHVQLALESYATGTVHLKIELVQSSGGTTLIPKRIIANGTYDPGDDDADGYSQVIVNVPGGDGITWETKYDGTVNVGDSGTDLFFTLSPYPYAFSADEIYRITFDDEIYICNTWSENTSIDGYSVGNALIAGGADTGEPFAFSRDTADIISGYVYPGTSTGIKTFKIELQVPRNNRTTWEIVTQGAFNIFSDEEGGYFSTFLDPFEPIGVGEVWRITWDDTQYICTAQELFSNLNEYGIGYCIGNALAFGGTTGNNEPFVAGVQTTNTNPKLYFYTSSSSGRVNLIVEKQVQYGDMWKTIFSGLIAVTSEEELDYYGVYNPWYELIAQNSIYKVTWGDTVYICTATFTNDWFDNYCLGNPSVTGESETGNNEPFMLCRMWGHTLVAFANTSQNTYIKIQKLISDTNIGLKYETGTWTPVEDVQIASISFNNQHTVPPFYYCIYDVTQSTIPENSAVSVSFNDMYQIGGYPLWLSNTYLRYGYAAYLNKSTGTSTSSSNAQLSTPYTDSSSEATTNSRYWATETSIKAYSSSTSRYWRSGRTYKWIAVWAPST